jgi:hypothetical protein
VRRLTNASLPRQRPGDYSTILCFSSRSTLSSSYHRRSTPPFLPNSHCSQLPLTITIPPQHSTMARCPHSSLLPSLRRSKVSIMTASIIGTHYRSTQWPRSRGNNANIPSRKGLQNPLKIKIVTRKRWAWGRSVFFSYIWQQFWLATCPRWKWFPISSSLWPSPSPQLHHIALPLSSCRIVIVSHHIGSPLIASYWYLASYHLTSSRFT